MNKASHSSGISLTFTSDPFIQWFKGPGLSYLTGIKQWRKCTHPLPQCVSVCACEVYHIQRLNERADLKAESSLAVLKTSLRTQQIAWTSHHQLGYWSCGWLQGSCWRRRLLWPSASILSQDSHSPHWPVENSKTRLVQWTLCAHTIRSRIWGSASLTPSLF